MKAKSTSKKSVVSFSIKALAIPFILIVAIIHISIIMLIIDINHSSNNLFNLMERSGAYQIDATNMQASNTVMSETCNNYLQFPTNGMESNVGPLIAYVNELSTDRRSPKVAERFRTYDVSYEVRLCVEKASEYSEQIMNTQVHAIAVMASVYPLPNLPSLAIFNSVELTPEELAMNSDERVSHARHMVQVSEYAQLRYQVEEKITACNTMIQDQFTVASDKTEHHVAVMRNILWVGIFVVTFILIGFFVIFYYLMIKPLRAYSKDIESNQSIKNPGKITELKQLVNAFNGLWDYRNKLESILRTEAENDALTGLPNRYCMEHDLLKNENNEKAFAVLMFDVNFLKRTNDTKGHLAGDALIRTTATCIRECFGQEEFNNCYRIGGDEFIALLSGCTEEDIKIRIDKFNLALVREKISVSVGYAYTDNLQNTKFDVLMAEADKKMYEQKKHVHKISN